MREGDRERLMKVKEREREEHAVDKLGMQEEDRDSVVEKERYTGKQKRTERRGDGEGKEDIERERWKDWQTEGDGIQRKIEIERERLTRRVKQRERDWQRE